jgi:hypothetical protein
MFGRQALLVSVITLSALANSPIASFADEQPTSAADARKVAQTVVNSYMKAYDARDPKALSAFGWSTHGALAS